MNRPRFRVLSRDCRLVAAPFAQPLRVAGTLDDLVLASVFAVFSGKAPALHMR